MTTRRRQYCRLCLFHVLNAPSGLEEDLEAKESVWSVNKFRVAHHILDAIRKVAITFVRRLKIIQVSPNRAIISRKKPCPGLAMATETATPRPEAMFTC